LLYLGYVDDPRLIPLTNITVLLILPVLNILANIFQIFDFLKGASSKKGELEISRGRELFTPLFLNTKEIMGILETQREAPKIIDTSVWNEKSQSYLFLSLKKEAQDKLNNFYQGVIEFNSLLRQLYRIVEGRISIKMYDYSAGILVPPVDWDGEYLIGLDPKFNNYCNEEAKRLGPEVCKVLINSDTLLESHLSVLANPFFDLLAKDDFTSFSFASRAKNYEEVRKQAHEFSKGFSNFVFTSLFEENILPKLKEKRRKLLEKTKDSQKYLESEIRNTTK